MAERAVHGLERIPRALDVALERVGFGVFHAAAWRRHALTFHLDQEIGQSALDRAEMVEARVGGVELLGQPHDAVFEIVDRALVGTAGMQLIDLVGEAAHHRLEAGGVAGRRAARLLQRVGDCGDPLLHQRERVGRRDLIDAGGKHPHFIGQLRERVVRGDMRNHAAQCDDRAFELLERLRIRTGTGDAVDLVRQAAERLVESGQAFSRGQRAQRVADFGEAALDARHRDAIGAGMAFAVDARRQRADLGFQGLDRLPRHRFLEHHADLGKVVAQGLDRGVDSAGPHGLDAGVDLAELLLEVGQLLRRCARQFHRCGGGATAVEHALRGFDFGQRLVDRDVRAGRRRRGPRRGWRCVAQRRRTSHGPQAIDLAVEPRQHIGDRTRIVAAHRRLPSWRAGRVGGAQVVDLAGELVEPGADIREARLATSGFILAPAAGVGRFTVGAAVVEIGKLVRAWLDPGVPRGLGDDGVEPLLDRHPRSARGFTGGVDHLRPDASHVPRNARSHARIQLFTRRGSRGGLCQPTAPLTGGGRTARPCTPGVQFLRATVNERLRNGAEGLDPADHFGA